MKRGEKGREEREKGRVGERGKEEGRDAEEEKVQAGSEGRDGLDSGEKKQEAEEDGSDLRQGGWNENGCDGDVAKRQKKVQNILKHSEWRRLERVRDMRGKDPEQRRRNSEREVEPVSDKCPEMTQSQKEVGQSDVRRISGKIIKMISETGDEEHGMQCFEVPLQKKS